MLWTTDKPTEPDYYLYYKDGEIQVVKVYRDSTDGTLFVIFPNKNIYSLDSLSGKWYTDKIEVPEEIIINNTFKPFDKVLVRDEDDDRWEPALFVSYNASNGYSYRTMNGYSYRQCIQYEGNEHLANKFGE